MLELFCSHDRPHGERESRQQSLDDLAEDVGQPEVAALEPVSQPGMVEAEEVEDRGVQVVYMDPILHDVESELVGLAIADTRLDAAAGHPHRERVGMMVTAVVAPALYHRRAAELSTPDDEGILEHPPLLQVLDQRGAGPVGDLAVLRDVVHQVPVLIPRFVEDLHEPDAALEQPPCDSRQVLANDGFPGSAPYISRICFGS